MRRIVFDCDRCGKKDVSPVFSRYLPSGESEEYLLDADEQRQIVQKQGHESLAVSRASFCLLEFLENEKGWQHYCQRCFSKLTDSLAAVLQEKRVSDGRSIQETAPEGNGSSKKTQPKARRQGKSSELSMDATP